jgi:hypothetical protein
MSVCRGAVVYFKKERKNEKEKKESHEVSVSNRIELWIFTEKSTAERTLLMPSVNCTDHFLS